MLKSTLLATTIIVTFGLTGMAYADKTDVKHNHGNDKGGSASSTSTNKNTNTNTNRSTNTNRNTSSSTSTSAGGAGGSSTATGGSSTATGGSSTSTSKGGKGGIGNGGSATGGDSSTTVTVNGAVQARNPVSSSYAPALTASAGTCMGSTSAGVSTMSLGLSMGNTWQDEDCNRRRDAAMLIAMGNSELAMALMAQSPQIKAALRTLAEEHAHNDEDGHDHETAHAEAEVEEAVEDEDWLIGSE